MIYRWSTDDLIVHIDTLQKGTSQVPLLCLRLSKTLLRKYRFYMFFFPSGSSMIFQASPSMNLLRAWCSWNLALTPWTLWASCGECGWSTNEWSTCTACSRRWTHNWTNVEIFCHLFCRTSVCWFTSLIYMEYHVAHVASCSTRKATWRVGRLHKKLASWIYMWLRTCEEFKCLCQRSCSARKYINSNIIGSSQF